MAVDFDRIQNNTSTDWVALAQMVCKTKPVEKVKARGNKIASKQSTVTMKSLHVGTSEKLEAQAGQQTTAYCQLHQRTQHSLKNTGGVYPGPENPSAVDNVCG